MKEDHVAAVVLVVTVMAASSLAQVVANDAYQVNYFEKFGFLTWLRIINTGQVGSPVDPTTKHGTVCADIYVFDANQEMMSCCSCAITANGLRFAFGADLTLSALTGFPPAESGVIKVVADAVTTCDPRTITSPISGALRAFDTHFGGTVACIGNICEITQNGTATESEFQRAPLTQAEQSFLGNACSFVQYLGSGRGVCPCSTVLPG